MKKQKDFVHCLILLTIIAFKIEHGHGGVERRLFYTEDREKCRSYNPLRKPLFGDTHVHTSRSLDAATQDTRTTPYQAYQFAKGERILLHPWIAKSKEGKIHLKNTFLKKGQPFDQTPTFEANAQRSSQLGRPLDFAMVSDHAEFFGEMGICNDEDSHPKAFNSKGCKRLRENLAISGMDLIKQYLAGLKLGVFIHNNEPLPRDKFCGKKGKKCLDLSKSGWKEVIDSAQAVYDKTPDCQFTSFIGYEYTLSPLSWNLHRNVLFRNDKVPSLPITSMEAKHPEALLDQLIKNCIENENLKDRQGRGCEVLTIPHNSNMSNGRMFSRKIRTIFNKGDKIQGDFDQAYAKKRASLEPLIEIFQHKGDSECHYYKKGSFFKQKAVINNIDEFCRFEKMPYNNLTADKEAMFESWFTGKLPLFFSALSTYPDQNNFIRYALKRGLQLENKLKVNPFKYGFIGSTDTHIGTPGATSETSFKGHGGAGAGNKELTSSKLKYEKDGFPLEISPKGLADFMSYGPGGLAVVWSEENSRDYIFDSMKRKETYATSGTRIILRFFGGWDFTKKDKKNLCKNVKYDSDQVGLTGGEFVREGYKKGVPMGSDLAKIVNNNLAPTFAVAALKDPGYSIKKENMNLQRPDVEERSTPLKMIQIIKGWVDSKGKSHEKVYNVAGANKNGSQVDLNTCEPKGQGQNELCTLWTDPDFNPKERAFYYARVIENPVCRWSWLQCINFVHESRKDQSPIKYFSHYCSNKKRQKEIPKGFRNCCLHKNIEHLNPKNWEKTQLGTYSPTIHERAWSSPIWFNPKNKR